MKRIQPRVGDVIVITSPDLKPCYFWAYARIGLITDIKDDTELCIQLDEDRNKDFSITIHNGPCYVSGALYREDFSGEFEIIDHIGEVQESYQGRKNKIKIKYCKFCEHSRVCRFVSSYSQNLATICKLYKGVA
jgi:hypothetical protein